MFPKINFRSHSDIKPNEIGFLLVPKILVIKFFSNSSFQNQIQNRNEMNIAFFYKPYFFPSKAWAKNQQFPLSEFFSKITRFNLNACKITKLTYIIFIRLLVTANFDKKCFYTALLCPNPFLRGYFRFCT